MFARSSGTGVKMRNKRNRNNFIKVNGFIKKRKELIFVVAGTPKRRYLQKN